MSRPADLGSAVPVALLGVGGVGLAVLERLARIEATRRVRLVYVANSWRAWRAHNGLDPGCVRAGFDSQATADQHLPLDVLATALEAGGWVIDATASEAVAACHASWLRAGVGVVTANKAGVGGAGQRYRAIAAQRGRYGDSATVGAGLPLLRSVRALREGGDMVRAISGQLSGTLAWLFDRYDGELPFSQQVAQAQALGYCEPDPRVDLSGLDVRRKLLILARAAGAALEPDEVAVQSLVPPALAVGDWATVRGRLQALDDAVHARWREAQASGRRLRYVARWTREGGARIGLEALAVNDPVLGGRGCDNRVAIWSCRYREQPLVVQGPGAGTEVTAAALLDDLLCLGAASSDRLTRTAA